MQFETKRLILRPITQDDFENWAAILSDAETMKHYPAPYDAAGVQRWIDWTLKNYEVYGFGLWAVILKENGQFIGDCGITMQPINGKELPEIGYHVHKDHWRRGYGSEAARAVRDWTFRNTAFDCLYSYMTASNTASYSTAAAAGLKRVKSYPDPVDGTLLVYAISREEWMERYNFSTTE